SSALRPCGTEGPAAARSAAEAAWPAVHKDVTPHCIDHGMSTAVDHVFICCSKGAPEAEALVELGLVEGSGNVHLGQGTANRRFFFKNTYLELLWISDEAEARSSESEGTRLWDRCSSRNDGACPFG